MKNFMIVVASMISVLWANADSGPQVAAASVHAVIELIDPDRGGVEGGTIVVISGFNFVSCGPLGTCPERRVTIDGVEPEIIEWTNTRIVVRTLPHPPGEVAISIWEGPTIVTTAGFTYLLRAESIPSLWPEPVSSGAVALTSKDYRARARLLRPPHTTRTANRSLW